jgi:hypothetical protein
MRGFRQNRANLNQLTSHYGKKEQSLFKGGEGGSQGHGGSTQAQHKQRPALPDWLKSPETREREKLQAQGQPPVKPVLRLVPQLRAQPKPQVEAQPAQAKRPEPQVKPAPIARKTSPKRKAATAPKRKAVAKKPARTRVTARGGKAKTRKAA